MKKKSTQQAQQRKQSSGPIPLGHAREYGKHVDVINWGIPRPSGA